MYVRLAFASHSFNIYILIQVCGEGKDALHLAIQKLYLFIAGCVKARFKASAH